jgi:hypothetical protein
MGGKPFLVRVSFGLRASKYKVRGCDIAGWYRLSEVAEAVRDLEAGHAQGKVVITV